MAVQRPQAHEASGGYPRPVDGGACGLTGSEHGKPRPPKVAAPEPKSQLSLEGCQAGHMRFTEQTTPSQPQAQTHHIALCLVAYLIVERERFDQGMTWRQFKRHLILKRSQIL